MKDWLQRHYGLVLAILLALALGLPALDAGPFNDDYTQRVGLRGHIAGFSLEPWGMYDFASGGEAQIEALKRSGGIPWWTSEDFTMRFFRPLASLTLALDVWVFGDDMTGAHAHSLLWLLVCICLAYLLLRRLLPARTAHLATVLYAAGSFHLMPAFWVATRHVYVAGALGLAMLLGLVVALEDRRRRGLWLGLGTLVLGLPLGGEAFLGSVLFALVLIAWRARGKLRASLLAVYGGSLAGALALYQALGFGLKGSGMYLDPLGDPWGFAGQAWRRGLALYADALLNIPALFYASVPEAQPVLTGLGFLAAAGLCGLLWSWREHLPAQARRHLPWLLLGGTASFIPGLAGSLGGRMLVLGMVGFTAGLASLGLAAWRIGRGSSGLRRLGAVLLLLGLALTQGLFALVVRVALTDELRRMGAEVRRIAIESPIDCPAGAEVVLLATDDPALGGYIGLAMIYHQGAPLPWQTFRLLSAAPHDHRVTRSDDRALELEVLSSPRRPGFWEHVYRRGPMPQGLSTQVGSLQVRVLEAEAGGWTRARFSWDKPLDPAHVCFVHYNGSIIAPWRLPRPGSSAKLERKPGPMTPRRR